MQVVLGALELCCRALHTLAATTAGLDVLEDVLWPGVEANGNLEAPPPTTPKLLPSVHLFWAPLMSALQVVPTQTLFLPFVAAYSGTTGCTMWSAMTVQLVLRGCPLNMHNQASLLILHELTRRVPSSSAGKGTREKVCLR